MLIDPDDRPDFTFALDDISHPVYKRGAGPGVLILHELPGMTPECITLAELVAAAGYTVYLPLLYGKPGDDHSVIHGASAMAMCIRHEFECFATSKTSRISHWLRALCARMKAECGGKGVGAIGMCFTGSVILAVMLEDALLVPVLSQPAMPFHEGFLPGGPSSEERKRALGIHPNDLRQVVARAADTPILGYRFTTDRICPKERFETLRQTFGENFSGTEIPTGPDHPGRIKDGAHSVLTKYFVDEPGHPTRKALDEILGRFAQRLH